MAGSGKPARASGHWAPAPRARLWASGIEVGKAMGAIVIASAGGADKLAAAREAGADHLIDYRKEDLRARVYWSSAAAAAPM